MLDIPVQLFIAITCDGNFAQKVFSMDPRIRSRSTGKLVGQKFDCSHGWRNLINKRAPRGFLPNIPHVRHFRGVIRGPWKWRDWIGRRHVFNKTRRARDRKSRGPESKPVEGSAGISWTRWSHPFSGRMKGTPIITFPLRDERTRKALAWMTPICPFSKGTKLTSSRFRARSLFSAIFIEEIIRVREMCIDKQHLIFTLMARIRLY